VSEQFTSQDPEDLAPVHELDVEPVADVWTRRLVLFLRTMAGIALIKGLYHWSRICGIGVGSNNLFELHSIAWQTATVFFAVIDLVAAVGLWLAAAWGAVIWLTSIASMLALAIFFPQVFGGGLPVMTIEGVLLVLYLWLALKSAQEQPP
jgi:Family of unknown function (DUF6163)